MLVDRAADLVSAARVDCPPMNAASMIVRPLPCGTC
jgi:hypothetical protein